MLAQAIQSTQKYMHPLANTNGEWIVEGTTDEERAKQLLAADFRAILFKKTK